MEDRHSRKMIAPIVITVLMVMYYVGFFVRSEERRVGKECGS